ncbi:MAG: NAD-dependent epimerase/dehydratase family protein [Armatimonadota bacterium]|nr:NAD-dependent epimerase/dehydratase family protein [Armatimonadota bacterium]MDR7449171.1 NAD-dependent epimerase/dehydratase family protein [Armatimonadota bacterium]MDR7459072.1 NAD-dependent epimerase/dehydratase family protein [Armatimonadota bacterium]MDR7479388.1 NAD-dependent epimerase/dehydratase family protein [Armatimonadota bacterium]MDR7487430.1 NAD-dependent epimerase/dehydratase family protein [Armatimonadota bacterium]
MRTARPVRLGIVGCGAVTQICHLPAARSVPDVEVVALADLNLARARFLAARFGVARYSTDYHAWLDEVDGVILALPHALHVPVASELLERGLPVLLEKPLAVTVREAEELVARAAATGTPLQPGYMFRHNRSARVVKHMLEAGWIGRVQTFVARWGGVYRWPVASGFFWDRQQAGGGVVVDAGSHLLDLLLWWFGDVLEVEYRDDSRGGVEADAWMRLVLQGPHGPVRGEVVISRLRHLRSHVRLDGEQFVVDWGSAGDRYAARIAPQTWNGDDPRFLSQADPGGSDTFVGMFAEQLRAFARTIRGAPPAVSARDVLPTVALIERCYRERAGSLLEPWDRPVSVTSPAGPVLVTGATGFIGGRLAEVLAAQGVPVRALVRTWSRAARLARLPVELVGGDMLDLASLRRAAAGCRTIYHCAVDFAAGGRAIRRSSALGARHVLQAALNAGVERVVLLSTVAVYGADPPPGSISEDTPVRHEGDDYADGKIDAEAAARDVYHRYGLPIVILRPPIVYGPFSSRTVSLAQAIRAGRLALIADTGGVCNTLYVDDLVAAMLLAAAAPGAPGQTFHVTDGAPVTWHAFIEAHARALEVPAPSLPRVTLQELEQAWAAQARGRRTSWRTLAGLVLRDSRLRETVRALPVVATLERLGRLVAPEAIREQAARLALAAPANGAAASPPPPSRSLARLMVGRTVYDITRARQVLGYTPAVDFHEGMARTAAWMRWAHL